MPTSPRTRFTFAGAWQAKREGEGVQLSNRVSGRGFKIDAAGGLIAAGLNRLRAAPATLESLAASWSELGPDALALIDALKDQRALRSFSPGRVRVTGSGEVARHVRASIASGGWRLPTLRVADQIRPGQQGTRGTISLGAHDGGLLAIAAGASPCLWCFKLRLIGRGAEPGRLRRPSSRLPARLGMLTAELLTELHLEPLAPGLGLLVRPGLASRRAAVLPHPDCAACQPRRAAGPVHRQTLAALKRGPIDPGPHRAFTDPDTGPLRIFEHKDPSNRFPFGAPFVWGSLRLVRDLGGRLASVSTEGGIYGKGPDAETCKRLAVSEGVERLAALSVRPDGAGKPWVHGLDLLSRRPVRLPLERVAVGLPPHAFPRLAYREPFYSGAASHLSFADAVTHATLELLERDAFMIAWYRRRALPPVAWPAALTALSAERRRYLAQRGFTLELFDLRSDMPFPMLLLRVTGTVANGNWPMGGAMLFASGAFTAARALERVLALACGQFLSLGLEAVPERDPLNPAAVAKFGAGHVAWPLLVRYLNPTRSSAHAFLGGGAELGFDRIPGEEPVTAGQAHARLGEALSAAGLPWLCARLTDAATARAGFEVAKVVIPGLVSLAPTRARVGLELPRLQLPWAGAQPGLHPEPHPLY